MIVPARHPPAFRDLVFHYDVVDSTMEVARTAAAAGAAHGTSIVARAQIAGRGRRGRTWLSERDAGLWLTTILRPGYSGWDPPPDASSQPRSGARGVVSESLRTRVPELSIVAAVAVATALEDVGVKAGPPDGLELKWPNDVLVGGRKLAGILLEAHDLHSDHPTVCVGIGLNLAPGESVPLTPEVHNRYIGLHELITPQRDPRREILCRVLDSLQNAYADWSRNEDPPFAQRWAKYDGLAGCTIRAESAGGILRGVAIGLSARGRLQLQTGSGVVEISAGEVEKVIGGSR